jgi:hypothetical protein
VVVVTPLPATEAHPVSGLGSGGVVQELPDDELPDDEDEPLDEEEAPDDEDPPDDEEEPLEEEEPLDELEPLDEDEDEELPDEDDPLDEDEELPDDDDPPEDEPGGVHACVVAIGAPPAHPSGDAATTVRVCVPSAWQALHAE